MDKVRILIKILEESHMAFNLGDKIDIQNRQTNLDIGWFCACAPEEVPMSRSVCLSKMSMLSSKLRAK